MLEPKTKTELIIEQHKRIRKLEAAMDVQRLQIIDMTADKNRIRDYFVRAGEELDVIINE